EGVPMRWLRRVSWGTRQVPGRRAPGPNGAPRTTRTTATLRLPGTGEVRRVAVGALRRSGAGEDRRDVVPAEAERVVEHGDVAAGQLDGGVLRDLHRRLGEIGRAHV